MSSGFTSLSEALGLKAVASMMSPAGTGALFSAQSIQGVLVDASLLQLSEALIRPKLKAMLGDAFTTAGPILDSFVKAFSLTFMRALTLGGSPNIGNLLSRDTLMRLLTESLILYVSDLWIAPIVNQAFTAISK